jgi:hypothetical protein
LWNGDWEANCEVNYQLINFSGRFLDRKITMRS